MKSSGVLATLMLAVALFGAAQATDCTVTTAPVAANDCTTACEQGLTNAEDVAASAEVTAVTYACSRTDGGDDSTSACAGKPSGDCTAASATCTNTPEVAYAAAGQACPGLTVVNCVNGNGNCVITDCVLASTGFAASDCTSSCGTLTQAEATAAVGGGSACGTPATYACQPGDGACPATVTYSWTSAVADDDVAFTCSTTPGAAAATLTRVVACTASDASTVADASASCPDSGATNAAAKTAVSDKTCSAVANVCSSDTTSGVCTGTTVKVDTNTCGAAACGAADFGGADKACCAEPLPLCSTVTTGNTCTGTAVAAASTATCAADPCVASTDFGAATTACCQAPPVACSTKTTGNTCTGGAVLDAGTKLCAADPCDASDFGAATTNCCKAKPPAPPASGAATAAVSLTALLALVLA